MTKASRGIPCDPYLINEHSLFVLNRLLSYDYYRLCLFLTVSMLIFAFLRHFCYFLMSKLVSSHARTQKVFFVFVELMSGEYPITNISGP